MAERVRRAPRGRAAASTARARKRIEAQVKGAPFVASVLRARLVSLRPGEARLVMRPRAALRQYQGILQGGALTGFADAAATFAVNSLLAPEEDSVTVQLSMSFLAPAVPGALEAVGRVVHRGRRTAVATAEVRDARGTLSCTGTFTCLVIPAGSEGRRARAGAPGRARR